MFKMSLAFLASKFKISLAKISLDNKIKFDLPQRLTMFRVASMMMQVGRAKHSLLITQTWVEKNYFVVSSCR